MKNKTRKKTIAFLLGLAMAILSATPVQAQGVLGDLLDEYYAEKDQQSNNSGGVMGRGSSNSHNIGIQDFGATPESNINVEDFGSPLGNEVLVLLAAGVVYATLKKSKNKAITTENN